MNKVNNANANSHADALSDERSPSTKSRAKNRTGRMHVFKREDALAFSALDKVQWMSASDLAAVKSTLGHGETPGIWSTPYDWYPLGSTAQMRIDLRKRIVDSLSVDDKLTIIRADNWNAGFVSTSEMGPVIPSYIHSHALSVMAYVVLVLTRYLVVLRMATIGVGRATKSKSLDPANILRMAYGFLPRLFGLGISYLLREREVIGQVTLDSDIRFLEKVNSTTIEDFPEYIRNQIRIESERMYQFSLNGFWQDVPLLDRRELSIKAEAPPQKPKRTIGKHLPFPDQFVTDMGFASLWIIQSLGPNLVKILTEIQSIWKAVDSTRISAHRCS
jgi:hypothetical protein